MKRAARIAMAAMAARRACRHGGVRREEELDLIGEPGRERGDGQVRERRSQARQGAAGRRGRRRPASDKGPPPEGIFAPGVADQRHPKGRPTGFGSSATGPSRGSRSAGAPRPTRCAPASYGPAALRLGEQRAAWPCRRSTSPSRSGRPRRTTAAPTGWWRTSRRPARADEQQIGPCPPGWTRRSPRSRERRCA